MTGSYGRNKSGGVLRKNIGDLANEINVATDGTFKATPETGGIINALNRLRIYGYDFNEGFYNNSGANGDNCPRSEEHTSELQSRGHLVCRLLLEKKNNES